jgi:hypothetical protein
MTPLSSLISLLAYGIALCGIVPLFPWLETAPRLILAAGMAAGIWQDIRSPWPLKNWIFNTAIVPVFLFYAVQFSHANPVQPVVSALAIMLAVRVAGPKNARHYLQISALALFCLASSSLFDLSPSFLAYLVLMLLLVAVQLVLVTFYSHDNRMLLVRSDLRKVLLAGVLMPLASLPLLLLFFPILPRTQMPLWNFVATSTARLSGFSEQVEPGSSTAVGESRAPVFRAEMPRQPQQQLYWRGTVFNRVEGRRWMRLEPPSEHIIYKGRRIIQTLYPEPDSSHVLPWTHLPLSRCSAHVGRPMVSTNFRGAPGDGSVMLRSLFLRRSYRWRARSGVRFTWRCRITSLSVSGSWRPTYDAWAPATKVALSSWRGTFAMETSVTARADC